jgi:Nucleotidyl transferase AbiEii toxin, Type IV TA system
MPLTALQRSVLQLLAKQREPESHVAGGIAINRTSESPRYSADIDFFHDLADRVFANAESDAATLVNNGYAIDWLLRQPYLHRAMVRRDREELKLEWCFDSAFRFFPVQADPEFGYCLHPADLATNKVLALAGRSEIRDLIDVLFLHETYLNLGAICWAACAKDPGFNPVSLLEAAKRQAKFREADLAGEKLRQPIQLAELKEAWLKAAAQAEDLVLRLPAAEVGCLYLTSSFQPVSPDPASPDFAKLIRHFGSIRGAWPVLA